MRRRHQFTFLTAVVVPLMLATASTLARADPTAEVEAATAQWINAFNRKNTTEIVALYAPDAVFFGTTSPVLRDNPELIQDYFKGLAHLGESNIALGDHRVQVFGTIAVSTGYYTLNSQRDDSGTHSPARFTFVYQLRNGSWMIVAHHSSALP